MRIPIHMILPHIGNRRGQGMVEYALIIAFVAILLVSVLGLIHIPVAEIFETVSDALGMAP